MFIESCRHTYYNTRYIAKYYLAINEIRIVMHDGEDALLYVFQNIGESSTGMQVLNHLMRNESSVVTSRDFYKQFEEEYRK